VRSFGWHFFTRLKSNRLVNPEGEGSMAVADLDIPEGGRVVHLRGYGLIRLFRVVEDSGKVFDEAQHWATGDLEMTEAQRAGLARQAFAIETYHRGLKQCCGVERCQARKASAQRGHTLMALRAFVRLEAHRLKTGLSWYETKKSIIRQAIQQYLKRPNVQITATA
jgi:putative transposase